MKRIAVFLLLFSFYCSATDIGSDTAVTRFTDQQIIQNGDRVAGFAWLNAGFALDNADATGTFDSVFPVSGNLAFNYGTLILNTDLIMRDESFVLNWGNIVGNSHIFQFSVDVQCVPEDASGRGDCRIDPLTSINAGDFVYSVDWNATDEYIAVGVDQTGGDELRVYSFDGASLSFIDGVNLGEDVNSVRWHPTNDWIAAARDSDSGGEVYIYSFNGTSLSLLDEQNIGSNTNAVAWHPDGDYLAVGSNANRSEFQVYPISGGGIFGTPATISFSNVDCNSVAWSPDGNYVVAGSDASGSFDELRVYAFTPGAPPTLTLNASFNVGQQVNSVDWNPVEDVIAIGVRGGSQRLLLYRFSPGSLTEIIHTAAIGTSVFSVNWGLDGACLAAGLKNNSEGSGGELRTYQFYEDNLSQEDDIEIGSNTNSVRWSNDGQYLASGDSGDMLRVALLADINQDISNVVFTDLHVQLSHDLTLQDTSFTFSGECLLDGKGSTLTMASTFSIIVAENSSLLLKDITIAGLSENTIRGTDALSTFSFENVTLAMDQEFYFDTGRIDLVGTLHLQGDSVAFRYLSDEEFIIRGGYLTDAPCSKRYLGKLIVDENTTFSYAPLSGSPDLIVMESFFSHIDLSSANFVTTELNLTKGSLQIDGRSYLRTNSTVTFGDGIDHENNLFIRILPAANLEVFGNLDYCNVPDEE